MKTIITTLLLLTTASLLQAQSGEKLTVSYVTSPKANTTGINFGRLSIPTSEGWGYGFDCRFEFIDFTDYYQEVIFDENPGINNYEYFALTAGVDFMQRMGGKFYFSFPLHIMFGGEKMENTFTGFCEEPVFMGVEGGLMFRFIPNEFGITVGLGLNGKVSTAEIYKNDLGLKLEFGFKF